VIGDTQQTAGRIGSSGRLALVLACALIVSVVPLAAQQAPPADPNAAYDGQPILQVEFIGSSTLSSETLRHYLLGRDETPVLDLEELNRRIHQLWRRELIDDVAVEIEPVEGGVKLIVRIEDRPRLVSIDYQGMKKLSKSDVRERIDRERLKLFEGQPLERGELERLAAVIEEMYQEKGYRFAQVSYATEEVGPGQLRVVYTIDEGDKVKIGDISFDGNTVFSDFRLRSAMKKTQGKIFVMRLFKKKVYNPANLEEDLESIRDLYRRQGFKDVLIGRPEIEVTAQRPEAPTIAGQKRQLKITIPIEEGERWKLGEISVEGNEVLADEILLRQFERPRGGWLRSKVIDDAIEKIDNLYRSVGYIFSEINVEVVERDREQNVADLIVHIEERDQYKVGRIEFAGNRKTRDKVLRRELLVQEATVMNMTALKNSLLKIRQLNYFELDEEEPIEFDFDNDAKLVNLKIKGEEADRTELQFGGGFSEFDGFFGQFSMRTTNFLGRGETMGISVQVGRLRSLFDVEYTVPWFLDRPQSIGVRLFDQEIDTEVLTGIDFDQKFSGGTITYGRNLRAFQSVNFAYSFINVDDTRTFIGFDGELVTSTNKFVNSSLRPFWVYNTLDSRFEPFRGLRLTGSLEIAGGALGGDTEFLKPVVGVTWFKPMSRRPYRSTFAINAELGWITSFGDLQIFPQQRFFIGGENSVRGFRRRSLVAIDEDGNVLFDDDGFPLGGDRMAQINLEYHVLAGGPFRLVFFADAGGVFTRDQSIDPQLMRYSAGVEMRILVPLFGAPLRFIYATNLDPLPTDQFESFDFNIGTSF